MVERSLPAGGSSIALPYPTVFKLTRIYEERSQNEKSNDCFVTYIGDSNVVGAATSYGVNGNCAGTGGVYRVDRADDQNWLATFGVVP